MKRMIAVLMISAALMTGTAGALPTLEIDGIKVDAVHALEAGTTYVSLRGVVETLFPSAHVTWANGQAMVQDERLDLTAVPGQKWLTVNGRHLYIPGGIKLAAGRTLVPVRVLAEAFGTKVMWDGDAGTVRMITTGQTPPHAGYDADQLYWLARIISAESQGEPLEGQIAVGNVVLNRVAHKDFPDSIFDVIFDGRWGGQFEPVRNGTIYNAPAESSVIAAKLCLEGAVTAGSSLYFFDPSKAQNFWVSDNRPYLTTIGCHNFYG